ncbi:MAG: transglutaminase domain-containing protein [Clostridia bacterium]|nr:transglutaminase domain-containing protein [Clostridia bacterium]
MRRHHNKLIGSILISAIFISIALIISILLARNQLHNDESPSDSDFSDNTTALVYESNTEEITILTPESSAAFHECLFDISQIEPTCTSEGYKFYVCECGNSYSEKYADKTDHIYLISSSVPSTCTKEGYTKYSCICGDIYTEVSEMLNHNYTETLFPATCTEKGSLSYSCSCGDSYSVVIEAYGHFYFSNTVEATCTTDGYTEYVCVCGDTYSEKTADKTGHAYFVSAVAPASCSSDGFTSYLCSCGSTYTEYSDKLEHIYIETTVPATCTEDGLSTFTCNCGYSYSLVIESKGHSYSIITTKSTCTSGGYTAHLCKCGYSYRDSYTTAAGHKWSSWTVSIAATTSRSGSQYRNCSVCLLRETKEIAKKTAVNLAAVKPISVFNSVSPKAMAAVNAVLDCVDKYYNTNNNDEIYLGVFELTGNDVSVAESAMVFYFGSYYDGFKCTNFYYIDDNHHHLFVNLKVLRRAENERRTMMVTVYDILSAFEAGSKEHLINQVFSFLAGHISYDGSQPDATVALKTGRGSCNAYPILFKIMLGELGIESEICIGYAYTGAYHAWNRVNLGGTDIYYDLTFYLSTKSKKYYAATSLSHDLCAINRYLSTNEKAK